jgi:hypothetical protein
MTDRCRPSASWAIWLRWVLACVVSWVLGAAVFGVVWSAVEGSTAETVGGVVALVAVGGVIATAQWLVVRRHMGGAAQWLWVSTAGAVTGVVVSQWLDLLDTPMGPRMELDGILAGAGFGVVLGAAQRIALQRWVKGAHWWVSASLAGGALSFFVADTLATVVDMAVVRSLVDAAIGAVYGATTGLMLVWLVRHPLSEPHTASEGVA